MKTNFISLLISLLFITSLTACYSRKVTSTVELSQLVRSAINNNDVDKLRMLSSLPLLISEQEWITANDGYGFVLGATKQVELSTDEKFYQYFRSTIKSLYIRGERVFSEDITSGLFKEELKEQEKFWNNLTLHFLKRGEGDVEHIILLGFEKNTNKIRAIYIN